MREYKYRGKRVDGCHNWVDGSLITNNNKYFIICDGNLHIGYKNTLGGSSIQEVIPETVGQYTGLMDKNGKESYHKDLVRCHDFYVGDTFICGSVGVVEWLEGEWVLVNCKGDYICSLWDCMTNYEGEIIGNIHDNKAVMEGEG